MRLRQVDARRADFLPQIRNGIQPDEARAVRHVKQQRLQQRQQDLRILHVQIHLVGAESGPNLLRPASGLKFRQQRQRTRADHCGQIRVAWDRHEEITKLRFITEEALKPVALSGHVVEHRVEHQIEPCCPKRREVFPGSVTRLDGEIILHRKAVIG